ncbi:MAG: ribosome recycling factor [Clostridia bacterium]
MDKNIIEEKMNNVCTYLIGELENIRAGRANPGILNKVEVEYYGTITPINQLATIAVPEARQIQITPWDRSALVAIEKGIQKADLGINPINDGSSIRLIFPELNEQRRKDISKEVSMLGEDTKVAIRNIRRDAMDNVKALQKTSEITEDDLKSNENEIQKITDLYIKKVDEITNKKEKEIMEI